VKEGYMRFSEGLQTEKENATTKCTKEEKNYCRKKAQEPQKDMVRKYCTTCFHFDIGYSLLDIGHSLFYPSFPADICLKGNRVIS